MIKIVIIFLFLLFFSVNAEEISLKAGIKYNEATARTEVFKDAQKKINKDFFAEYKKDKNRDENIKYIEANDFYIGNHRILCPFYFKKTLISYAVIYNKTPDYTFYYNTLGNLIKFEITISNEFPKKVLGYSRYGNLINATLEIDEFEQFVYDENGKLIAHWLNDEILNKNNKNPKVFKIRRGKNYSPNK